MRYREWPSPLSIECRLCHRIGTRSFSPAGAEGWECANDRACNRRRAKRAKEPS